MASLHVDRGEIQGQVILLNKDKVVLGRSPDCDAVISTKEVVSRWHAQILCVDNRYYIEDLKSRNKTYVNDKEIPAQTRVPLAHKDCIRICQFLATFFDGVTDENLESSSSVVEATLSSKSDHSLETQPAVKLAELLEITARLSKTLQLDTQLPEVAEGLLRLFPQADRCFLILEEEGTGNLLPKAVRTRGGADQSTARFSQTIVRQCLQTGQAILLREGDKIPGAIDSVLTARMRSVMCVPLCSAEGQAFGVIQLDTRDGAKKFNEEDLRLLWGVSQQASVAMENARYHELRLTQVRVKNELEMARQVQLNFLPRQLPIVPDYEFFVYYKAAREVGGDYYDFIHLPEMRLAVAIGDVAGKGMAAALLMARLFSESRSCFLTEHEPSAAISKLNQQLFPFTNPIDRFVTLASAVLDPTTHTLTLVNAGHPAPLWYHQAERAFSKAVPMENDGALLGVAENCQYPCFQLTLEPGDCLLMFSDGVTDAQSVKGRSFRTKGIHGILKSDEVFTPRVLGERVVDAVQQHAQGGAQYDDITLVCFGRTATTS